MIKYITRTIRAVLTGTLLYKSWCCKIKFYSHSYRKKFLLRKQLRQLQELVELTVSRRCIENCIEVRVCRIRFSKSKRVRFYFVKCSITLASYKTQLLSK